MGIVDLVFGELVWIALRLGMVATAFTLVIAAFGVARSPLTVLAIPAAVLTGVAFAAPLVAYAATLKGNDNFNVVFRFVITPLFLFSGVFFPLTRLPDGLERVAWFTPLFHGVELVRGLTLGTLESPAWVLHVAYLLAMTAVGAAAAVWTFSRRLRA
jgi:lipooligosaccharide transport system permease protein